MSRFNPAHSTYVKKPAHPESPSPSPFGRRNPFGVGRAATAFGNRVRREAEAARPPPSPQYAKYDYSSDHSESSDYTTELNYGRRGSDGRPPLSPQYAAAAARNNNASHHSDISEFSLSSAEASPAQSPEPSPQPSPELSPQPSPARQRTEFDSLPPLSPGEYSRPQSPIGSDLGSEIYSRPQSPVSDAGSEALPHIIINHEKLAAFRDWKPSATPAPISPTPPRINRATKPVWDKASGKYINRHIMLPAPVLPTAAEDMERIRIEAGYDSDDDFFDTKEELLQQAVRGIQKTDKGLKSLIEKPASNTEVIKPAPWKIEAVKHTPAPVIEEIRTSAISQLPQTPTQTKVTIEQATPPPAPFLSDEDWHSFNITVKVPRIRKKQNGQNKDGWKFTWFGIIISIFVAWYFAETAVCEFHCKPFQSTTGNNWYPGMPTFGLALPYKLDTWTGEVVSRTWHKVDRSLGPRSYPHQHRPTPVANASVRKESKQYAGVIG
ncbi:hypothetical protein GLAREA_11813 [Glarea lozoyensis ATCC 20868]|uniref:Uncharacterized protein n=2 Tax=Glarea lozoyensis TaxID=101852 RepID=S3CFG7_GLAL2|nr:uncharacterized protein GLAREA_11813 [Glarea lozoyensis ATCC 20868]EHL01303.1 hypothetical protein M7I_2772 [Glarea lozoyensis 74030]EPE25232.1 hypothetical protein GLAREA_11813 [Glarea lozoyensis ATCC 20868]